jgi:hypothetical protein
MRLAGRPTLDDLTSVALYFYDYKASKPGVLVEWTTRTLLTIVLMPYFGNATGFSVKGPGSFPLLSPRM